MNSSKTSNASSFDAGDYYKQITSCLAAKNNLKVNLNVIPGYQNHLKNRTANGQPLITRQHIQAKFLAKCNAKKLADEREANNGPANGETKQPVEKKAKPALAFVVKGDMGRKKQEDYINLPDSFFKSFRPEEVPGMPIFKVPNAPVKRRQATPVHDFSIPEQLPLANQSNVSMATVASGNFNPRPGATSTPHELPRAIISDPADLGNYFTNPKPILSAPVRTFRDKAKEVFEAFGKVAEKMDTNNLAKYPDPLEEIRGRLFEIYSGSCQEPRLINETLITVLSVQKEPTVEQVHPQPTYVLPVPVFYGTEENDKDVAMEPDPLSETAKIFNFTVAPRTTKNKQEAPASELDEDLWGDFTLDGTQIHSPVTLAKRHLDPGWTNMTDATLSQPDSQGSETNFLFGTPEPKNMEIDDTFPPTDDTFSDDWERPATASPSEIDNTFAIFVSPPKPGRRYSQRSQGETNRNRRSRDFQIEMHEPPPEEFSFVQPAHGSRRRGHSQRSQREDSRLPQLRDSNMDGFRRRSSTQPAYGWAPNYPFDKRSKESFNFR